MTSPMTIPLGNDSKELSPGGRGFRRINEINQGTYISAMRTSDPTGALGLVRNVLFIE